MPDLKRAVKDSVFSYLFKEPQYSWQLYRSLHPEDDTVREEDIKLVTLANIMTGGQYNDLGFLVKDKLIILAEAQSTFSVNISLRMLFYMAATYKDYVEEHKLDLYGTKKVSIPRPELYMIYTGKKAVPDTLRLSDLYQGSGSVETEVKVLRGDAADKEDIVRQYVHFCAIADEMRAKYGRTEEAVKAIIDRCIEEGVLVAFLLARRKEVEGIMVVLYDEAKVQEIHDFNVRKEALEKGIELGNERATERGISAMVTAMAELSLEKGAVAEKLVRHFNLSPQVAEAKVEQYWDR